MEFERCVFVMFKHKKWHNPSLFSRQEVQHKVIVLGCEQSVPSLHICRLKFIPQIRMTAYVVKIKKAGISLSLSLQVVYSKFMVMEYLSAESMKSSACYTSSSLEHYCMHR